MKNFNICLVISILVIGGLLFVILNYIGQLNSLAALGFNNQPFFSSLEQFILAGNKIELSDNIQVSSGDLAANQEIKIAENNIINGNLFSDKIKIGATSTINGNASFNELEIAPTAKILGQTSTLVFLPIIQLPEILAFQTGEQDLTITQNQTINPGNFDEIEVKENISLTLNPGIYNLNKLKLNQNSKLLFSALTTINIQKELVIEEKVFIAQTKNIPSTSLQINVQEDKDIDIGKDSLISLKLLAPNSQINLKQRITFRGQILAKEIKVGENSILSRQDFFSKESDPAKVIIDQDGSQFLVNEIVVNFTNFATFSDAQNIANLVNGRIIGFVESLNAYQIEIFIATSQELETKIQTIRQSNNPLVEGVFRNYIVSSF